MDTVLLRFALLCFILLLVEAYQLFTHNLRGPCGVKCRYTIVPCKVRAALCDLQIQNIKSASIDIKTVLRYTFKNSEYIETKWLT